MYNLIRRLASISFALPPITSATLFSASNSAAFTVASSSLYNNANNSNSNSNSNNYSHSSINTSRLFSVTPSNNDQSKNTIPKMSTEKKIVEPSAEDKSNIGSTVEGYTLSSNDNSGPDTVFDKLMSGEWKSDKVYEDDKAYAFRDVNPQAPVHILVIPKVRDGLVRLSKARSDQKEILGHLMYVAQEIGKKECPDGFRVVINDGENGQQTVFHLHLHVIGGRQLKWPPG